jgi:hypothetical protein
MGSSDVATIVGNRSGEQQGYNFDHCAMNDRPGDEVPHIQLPYNPDEDLKKYWDDEDAEHYVKAEGQKLILEVIRTPKIYGWKNATYEKVRGKGLSKYEKKFMKMVYPTRLPAQELYAATADCDDWKFCPAKLPGFAPLPFSFKYQDYCQSGIFRLSDSKTKRFGANEHFNENECTTAKSVEDQNIWIRVWYAQAYTGIIMKEEFDGSVISDELLVHVAQELEIKHLDKLHLTRNQLFSVVKAEIMDRYY